MSELEHGRPLRKLEAALEAAIPGALKTLDDYYAAYASGTVPNETSVSAILEYLYNYTTKVYYPYRLLRSRSGLIAASGGLLTPDDAKSLQQWAKVQAIESGEKFLRGKARRLNASLPMRVRNEMRAALLDVLYLYAVETDGERLAELGAKRATQEDLRAGLRRRQMTPAEIDRYHTTGRTPAEVEQYENSGKWFITIVRDGPPTHLASDHPGIHNFSPSPAPKHGPKAQPFVDADDAAPWALALQRKLTEFLSSPQSDPFDNLVRLFALNELRPDSLANARARAGLDVPQSTVRAALTGPMLGDGLRADETIAKRVLNDREYEIWSSDVPHGAVDKHREELARRGWNISSTNYRQIRLQARKKIEKAKLEESAAADTSRRSFDPADPETTAPSESKSTTTDWPATVRLSFTLPDDNLTDSSDDADDPGEDSNEPSDEQRDDERAWEDATYDAFDPRS